DQVAGPLQTGAVEQAGVEVGGEESDAGERAAKRLEHQQLVVHVAAEYADRPDAVGWARGRGIDRLRFRRLTAAVLVDPGGQGGRQATQVVELPLPRGSL